MFHKILIIRVGRFPGGHADDPPAPALLGTILRHVGPLDEPAMGQSNDHSLIGDQILKSDFPLLRPQFGQSRCRILLLDHQQFGLDDCKNTFLTCENIQQVLDFFDQLVVFAADFVDFQPRQLVKAQVENGIGLSLAESVTAIGQAGLAADQNSNPLNLLAAEVEGQQLDSGLIPVRRTPYDTNELVQIGQGD